MRPITIYKGDDTAAFRVRTLRIVLDAPFAVDATAEFTLLSFSKTFTPEEVASNDMRVEMTRDTTSSFPLGVCFGSFKLYDATGLLLTSTSRIPFVVKNAGTDFQIKPDKVFIESDLVSIRISFDITYSALADKPAINGVVIEGDKKAEEYGIVSRVDDAVEGNFPALDDKGFIVDSGKNPSDFALAKDTYTKEETDEAIEAVAAYYITYNEAGDRFPTKAALVNAQTYYSGGAPRVPTRNDYAVVLKDETHDEAEYRYIYAVAEGETSGQWEAQYPIEKNDYEELTKKPKINGVELVGDQTAAQLGLAPELFAQYYPEGNVQSASQFTRGIKYTLDDTTRTATVKPFCFTGTAANDNSNLEGGVVIPPFVDADGYPYLSDDGTRFKVVGVGASSVVLTNNADLTAIVAPTTLTSIGDSAFCKCLNLVSASLPAATAIGVTAFEGCGSLASVDFGDTQHTSVPRLGSGAFSNVPTACQIIVPYTQYDEWKAADGWKDLPQKFVRHPEKADKPATFTTGNFAWFDAQGNPVDSGKKPDDYEFESGPTGTWACTPPTTQYGTPFSVKWTVDPSEGEGWALFTGSTKQGKVLGDESSTELSWSPGAGTAFYDVSAVRQLSGVEYHLKGQPAVKLQPAGDYVPATRTVNGKPLTGDVSLSGADIPVDGTPNAQKINAALDGKLAKAVPVLWAALKDLRDGGGLAPGQQYRITDYVATTNGDMESQSANHPFDIIVVADSATTLNEHARAVVHEGDTYFASCNLAAWDLWYCIDNDTSRFAWATANGKGVIYRLVDESQNDCPYDFKGIQFKAYGDTDNVWRYTFDSGGPMGKNKDESLTGLSRSVSGNTIAPYWYRYDGVTCKWRLNCIVFNGGNCHHNTFGSNCHSNTFSSSCSSNKFGSSCSSNKFGSNCSSNTFSSNCSSNTFSSYYQSNTFGPNCSSNKFGSNCSHNTFGSFCSSNTFDWYCTSNKFGTRCHHNTFASSCSSNTFVSDCSYINFGTASSVKSYCRYITIQSGNQYIYLNPTGTTSYSSYYQNVEIKEGVNNTTTYKTIDDANVGQDFLTTYKPADSKEISI